MSSGEFGNFSGEPNFLSTTIDAYYSGHMTRPQAVEALVTFQEDEFHAQESLSDRLTSETAAYLNWKPLFTDDVGGMDVTEFDGRRAFWTGMATTCISVAVIGPAGIGGAHLRTYGVKALQAQWERLLKHDRNAYYAQLKKLPLEDSYATHRRLIALDLRKKILEEAIRKAFAAYQQLLSGRRSGPVITMATGVEYGSSNETKALSRDFVSLSKKLGGRGIKATSYIGSPGGIVYGGPSHPKYSIPQLAPAGY